METIFVAWQQPDSREWIPVARLDRDRGKYRFSYTQGAFRARGFQPFGRMDQLFGVYESDTLFPFFANRLISKSRPEFKDYPRWLGLSDLSNDSMVILALTGGIRGTDDLELFPPPTLTAKGEYRLQFFTRGLRHLPRDFVGMIDLLQPGARLFLMNDSQNRTDQFALALRSDDPVFFVGYCPKYYARDLTVLMQSADSELEVRVKSVNADAPLSMRLLCSVTAKLPDQFGLFGNNVDFEAVADNVPSDWNKLDLALQPDDERGPQHQ
jgi:hypothetical protein